MKINQSADYYYKAYFSKFNLTHFWHKKRLDETISFIPENSEVLDAGCGSGVIAYLLSRKGCKVTGIDIRKECIDFASKKCPQAKFYKRSLLNFDLKKEFDVIVCSGVIEHFKEDDRKKVVKNLKKHLKTNGTILFNFPSEIYIHILEPIWKVTRKIIKPHVIFDDDDIHEDVGLQELMGVLIKEGLKIKEYRRSCFGMEYTILATKI